MNSAAAHHPPRGQFPPPPSEGDRMLRLHRVEPDDRALGRPRGVPRSPDLPHPAVAAVRRRVAARRAGAGHRRRRRDHRRALHRPGHQALRPAHPGQPDGRLDHLLRGLQPAARRSRARAGAGGADAVRLRRARLRAPGDPRPRPDRGRPGRPRPALGRRAHRGDRPDPRRGRPVRRDGERLPPQYPQGRPVRRRHRRGVRRSGIRRTNSTISCATYSPNRISCPPIRSTGSGR